MVNIIPLEDTDSAFNAEYSMSAYLCCSELSIPLVEIMLEYLYKIIKYSLQN